MSKILFVTWNGGGNVPPALGIATALARRGHRVGFLGHAQQEEQIRARDFSFQPFRHARPWSSTAPWSGLRGSVKLVSLFADRGPGVDLAEVVTREPTDLVVVDQLMWGALSAAESLGVRHATLVHSLYGPQRDTWSRGPGALLARLQGRRPVQLWLSSERVIVATLRDLDPAGPEELPENVCYTGPVWEGCPVPATTTVKEPIGGLLPGARAGRSVRGRNVRTPATAPLARHRNVHSPANVPRAPDSAASWRRRGAFV
ncbi:MAG: hypothetical protein M3024_14260 [Candidatus Dormibacteraeota bacterium]|nr:hypothetical protein [Candidatus Dormibacteraeota bacterium]